MDLKLLSTKFGEFIKEEGLRRISQRRRQAIYSLGERVEHSRTDSDYISSVLQHYHEMTTAFVKDDFGQMQQWVEGDRPDVQRDEKRVGCQWFKEQKDLAFTELVNYDFGKWKNWTHMGELLARYMHMILTGKVTTNDGRILAKLSSADILKRCQDTSVLVGFLDEKHIFSNYYKSMLMERLLGDYNDSIERSVLAGLHSKYCIEDREQTAMLVDMARCKTIRNRFNEHWTSQQPVEHCESMRSLSITMLTHSVWPCPPTAMVGLHLPLSMDQCKSTFEHWWNKSHRKSRQLNYHWYQSTVTLQAKFPMLNPNFKVIELKMTALQAILLQAFSHNKEKLRSGHTMREIAEHMGIEWDTDSNQPVSDEQWSMLKSLFKIFLQPFPHCRGALILKGPRTDPPIRGTDKFKINPKFQSKKRVLSIRAPDDWDSRQSREETRKEKKKQSDRNIRVDVVIVTFMRVRRCLEYVALIKEVIRQLPTLKPSRTLIRRRITSLMDRDYLCRNDDNPREIQYLY